MFTVVSVQPLGLRQNGGSAQHAKALQDLLIYIAYIYICILLIKLMISIMGIGVTGLTKRQISGIEAQRFC